MGGEICTDNRFKIIAAYKKKLIEGTNIQASPEEMAVIDNILFRFWQMGWLPPIPHGRLIDADAFIEKCEEMADKEDGNQLDALVILRWFLEQNAPTVIPASEDC